MTKEEVPMFPRSGMHRVVLCAALSLFALPSFAEWRIDEDRSNSVKHGLYEIREEARQFLAKENARHGTRWESGEPNLKVVVPLCKTPLKSKWARGSIILGVTVTCARSNDSKQRPWNVMVPVLGIPSDSTR